MLSLKEYIKKNDCSAKFNEWIYKEFTEHFNKYELLLNHRKYIEEHNLGFGDRAFHYLWYLLINEIKEYYKSPNLLEIGVYKGQIISLWSILFDYFNISGNITAISPLEGNYREPQNLFQKIAFKLNPRIRMEMKNGNLYPKEDYYKFIEGLYQHFNLDLNKITIYKGYSSDKDIINKLKNESFNIIYIDGDHSYEGCKFDILNFTPKICGNGFLVLDDAACNIRGGGTGIYWKGHQSVSDAAEIIPELGFVNVLNVGHNRVYQKQ